MKRFKLTFFIFLLYSCVHATVYYVSPTGSGTNGLTWATAYTSPAAALAGAPVAGDEVWVQQGTYVSAATINWKTGINFYGGFVGNETARSQRSTDASLTILEGNNTNRVLNAPSMASATTWSGFTIQKGLSSGGGAGIFMQRNAILDNCIVQNNISTNWGGAGIYIQGADVDSIKVINCIVRDNVSNSTDSRTDRHGGGGIRIRPDAPKAVVRYCTIVNNISDGVETGNAVGGGVYMAAGTIESSVIKDNIVTNRKASDLSLVYSGKAQGGGIFIMPQTNTNSIIVKNCTVSGNSANTSLGGGISIDPLYTTAVIASPVLVQNTHIINNSAYRTGGGIMTDGQAVTSTSSYTFDNCVIANNESSTVAAGGGGAFVNNIADYAGTVSFNHCTVVNNKMLTTNYGGAGIFYNNIKADITNCVFWGNASVGAIAPYHVRVKTTLTTNKLLNCTFDSRFVEAQVSPESYEANLAGKVIVGLANTGTENGVLYARFENPTNFVGKALTEGDAASLAAANWALKYGSAMQDKGTTLAGITKDILGKARPQGSAYDIGAYEKEMKQVTTLQIASALQTLSKSAVIVGNGGTLVIDQNSELSALVIERGGRVSNENGYGIILSDSLIINSDANGTGTYVEKNNSTLTSQGTRVYQYLSSVTTGPNGRNWYISSPVSAAVSNTLTSKTGNGLVSYNEVTGEWDNAGNNMNPMVGYIAKSPAANTTILFEGGSLNTGTQTISGLSFANTNALKKGFNLIGNPYPSFLNWDDAALSGVNTSIWYRSKGTGSYLFQTYNSNGRIGTLGGTKYIPPMQSFWVRVTSATNSVGFNNNMRSHQDQSTNAGRLKVSENETQSVLRLEIANETNHDEAVIYFNSDASDGFDDFDSPKLFNNNIAIPELYSIVDNENMVINGLRNSQPNKEVQLGFYSGKTTGLKIRATELSRFSAGTQIILKDHFLNIEADLTQGDEYQFTSDATENHDRFSLLFKSSQGTTAINESALNMTSVYTDNESRIVIQSPILKLNGRVVVTNLIGKELISEPLTGNVTLLNMQLEKGVCIVSIVYPEYQQSFKIVIH
jgi:hypothetical protein